MSLSQGHLLHLRLFIEGVEVPVIGAMISATEGSPAAAQVEIIPTDLALRLLPRSKVHLFFLDYDNFVGSNADYPSTRDIGDQSKGIRSSDYKLLFTGELFTMMYTKTGYGSRSLILQCLDDSNLWDTSYLYLLRYGDTGGGESAVVHSTQTFMGAGTGSPFALDDILNDPALVISQIMQRQQGTAYSPALRSTSGLIGGLFAVLELLGGLPGKFVGVTGWHTVQEARVRLMDQLAGDSGDTAKALYDLAVFENWITNKIGDLGTVISFRDLINMINQYVFYGVVPNPVARYVPGSRSVPDWPKLIAEASVKGLNPEFNVQLQKLIGLLRVKYPTVVVKSGFRTLEERNEIRAAQGRESLNSPDYKAHDWGFAADLGLSDIGIGFIYEGTPYDDLASIPEEFSLHRKVLTIVQELKVTSWDAIKAYLTTQEISDIERLKDFFIDMGRIVRSGQVEGLTWGGDWTGVDPLWTALGVGSDPVHVQQSNWKSKIPDLVSTDLGASLDEFYATLEKREQLYTQFFRPDCWFVSPPACNVIFPEEVNSFTFTRQMMRETTRLQLTTFNALIAEDLILNQVFFAPAFAEVESLAEGGLGSAKEPVIYPHEKFSGIIPKMERMSEVSFYARLSEEHKVPKLSVEGDLDSEEQEALANAAESQITLWAARTAAFNFMSHRYSARSAVVAGRFMPRLVCGFPVLVVDRPVNASGETGNVTLPTHFLGMVRTLSHSLTQAGGSTSISMSHARSHKSASDLDDLPEDLLKIQVREGSETSHTITVGDGMSDTDFSIARDVSRWILSGNTLGDFSILISSESLGGQEVWAEGFEVFTQSGEPVVTDTSDTSEEEGLGSSEEGDIVTMSVEGREEVQFDVSFSKVTYTRRSTGTQTPIPIEDAIRPPWFSDEYTNAKIGTLYRKFFGCGSLVGHSGSVEAATDWVVSLYSRASGDGANASTFIHERTRRTFASLPQVLGDKVTLGFHQYAVGNRTKLKGLDGLQSVSGEPLTSQFNTELARSVNPALDPRKERFNRVAQYRSELLQFRGLRG